MLRSKVLLTAFLLLTMLLLGWSPASTGLEPDRLASQYVARIWTTADGLPDPAVRTVIQSRDGYLWLGTHAGLARFDGRRFVVFDRNNSGLGHGHVLALSEDQQGRIWIGTEEGLFRHENGSIKAVADFGSARILAVSEDPQGQVWVASERGLSRVSPDGSITSFGREQGLPAGLVHAIEAGDKNVLIGTESGVYELAGSRFEKVEAAGNATVRAVLRTRASTLWIASSEAILHLVEGKVARRIPVTWGAKQIWDLLEDRNGGIWSASYGTGIQRIKDQGFDTVALGEGYAERRPWRFLEDREGNLWVGTREGLIQLRDGPAITWSTEEGLAANHSRGIFEDEDGSIWVAHVGGVSRIDAGNVRNFGRADGLPADVHLTILRDHEGTLWVGGEGGLSRFDGTRFNALTRADGLPSDNVKIAINGTDGRIWTGHVGGVGLVLSGQASSPPEFGLLSNTSVEAMLESRDGHLYIGTQEHGLWRWRDGHLEEVMLARGEDRIGVRALHEDRSGRLWVGTVARGLIVLDRGQPHEVGQSQGFPIYGVWSIIEDGNGHWWFSSDTGIWRFRTEDLEALLAGRSTTVSPNLRLTERDGMKSRECNGGGSPAAVLASDGRLWVATGGGAVAVDAEVKLATPIAETAIVEAVRVGDSAITPSGDSRTYKTRARSVAIDYTALHLADAEALRFRYRLLGQNQDWIDAADRRTAFYTNLPPGGYRFEIASRLGDESPWMPGQGVNLEVTPYWHERASVRAAAALGVLGLMAWLIQRRLTAQRRTALELGRQVELRTAELRIANAELARIARIDSLTGVATARAFREHLATIVGPEVKPDSVALLLLDVDDFKLYNDTYGHLAGDECLQSVASVLGARARREDGFAARYGGEEFALLLAPGDLSRAITVAELLRHEVEALAIAGGTGARHNLITISVGIGYGTANLMTPAGLMEQADAALYAAKRKGRNRVEWATDSAT